MLQFMRYLTNYGSLMDNRPLMVVTGATNGLGRLAAITLAIGGADLAVIARSTDKASRLRQEIEGAAP
jgi:short-subunit dehydrogenase